MKISCFNCSQFTLKCTLLTIIFIGLVCTVAGTYIGVTSKDRDTISSGLALLSIGLITLFCCAFGWKLVTDGPECRSMLGLDEIPDIVGTSGSTLQLTGRRFLPRVPDPHGRSGAHHHPYGAMFYPEFQYRPPPPSYQASMQEYRLRLLLLERLSSHTQSTSLSPVSPPPTYRSSAASSLAGTLNRPEGNTLSRPISRPPSYRSIIDQSSVNDNSPSGQGTIVSCINIVNNNNNNSLGHQIYSSSLHTTSTSYNASQQSQGPITSTDGSNGTVTTISNHKDDVNRITIHQTNSTSTACTTNGINILAIPLTNENGQTTGHNNTLCSTTMVSNYSPSSIDSDAVTPNSNNLLTSAFNNGPNPSISNSRNSEVQILAHV